MRKLLPIIALVLISILLCSTYVVATDIVITAVPNYVGIPIVSCGSAINITESSAVLVGNILHTGGANVTMRGLKWGYSTGNYTWSWNETGNFGVGAFYHEITGLTPGLQISWRAFAENVYGQGNSTECSVAAGSGLPSAPTNFAITQIGYNSYNISWTMDIAAHAIIVRVSEIEYPESVTEGILVYSGNSTRVIVNGLDPNMTTYYYRAWSENDYGYSLDYAEAILGNPLGISQLIFALGLFGFALWKRDWIRTILSLCVIMWGTFAMPYDMKIAAPLIAVGTILFVISILDIRKGGDK